NPFTEGMTAEAAQVAMRLTFLHWGLHPWAIYVIVGLSLSYFAYRKKLPLTVRSSLYPLIGDRIYGPLGHAADVLAVFGTVFGLATSLGLGAQQMNTGLNIMFGLEVSETNQLILVFVVTSIATISVASGVGRGVKFLSEVNLWLSIIILVFFLIWGPTRYLLLAFLQNVGDYVAHVIPLSLWTDANKDSGWQDSWTTFYWGWWIAWSPFVGIFIARISRGRTIREFVLGVLLVPTLLAFVWLNLFGGTAIYMELFNTVVRSSGETVSAVGQAGIIEAVQQDLTVALYTTFDKMTVGVMGTIASGVATLLIATYFITSSDSATLVVNTILSVGDENPPLMPRIFWGIGEGFVAAVLLVAGGLNALQTASITAALPFSIIILIMVYGLTTALRQEKLGASNTQAC
ncbi:MAG: BCCT family transporter, partial [Pseudomonadota bacterium]|nr:BCCT family transporter [Pseudomonadota bacterium]